MYEHHTRPLLPRRQFAQRLGWHALCAFTVIGVVLAVGVAGYHVFVGLGLMDAFLNAAMIVSGMGPVADLTAPGTSDGAKLFAGTYALISGLVFVAVAGFLLAPVFHRVLHKLHLDDSAEGAEDGEGAEKD